MTLAAPLWLIGFIPWAALVLFLFLRRQAVTVVPYLRLWTVNSARPRWRVSIGPPPVSILLVLLAIALSILGAAEPRLERSIQLPTTKPISSAAITAFSAADEPHPQVMIEIRTRHFDRSTLDITIQTAGQEVVRTIDVKADGTTTTSADLSSLGRTVSASIGGSVPIVIERRGHAFVLPADAQLPSSLRRLLELMRPRHGGDDRNPVTVDVSSSISFDRTGVILAPPVSSEKTNWTVMDDPLTRDVNWSELTGGCAADLLSDAVWQPLVFSGHRVILARSKQSPSRVLISVATQDWPAMTSFVVFWTNAVDQLVGGDGQFERFEASNDGTSPPAHKSVGSFRDLSSVLFLLALIFLASATIFVPRQLTPYTARHVESAE